MVPPSDMNWETLGSARALAAPPSAALPVRDEGIKKTREGVVPTTAAVVARDENRPEEGALIAGIRGDVPGPEEAQHVTAVVEEELGPHETEPTKTFVNTELQGTGVPEDDVPAVSSPDLQIWLESGKPRCTKCGKKHPPPCNPSKLKPECANCRKRHDGECRKRKRDTVEEGKVPQRPQPPLPPPPPPPSRQQQPKKPRCPRCRRKPHRAHERCPVPLCTVCQTWHWPNWHCSPIPGQNPFALPPGMEPWHR